MQNMKKIDALRLKNDLICKAKGVRISELDEENGFTLFHDAEHGINLRQVTEKKR